MGWGPFPADPDPNQTHRGTGKTAPCRGWKHTGSTKKEREYLKHCVIITRQQFIGYENIFECLLEILLYICKSSKMEEEYERVKKLRKKSEPSWVLNPGPSDC